MRHIRQACAVAILLLPWLAQAHAQEQPKPESELYFDYDALIEELPIQSDTFGPPFTFDMFSGGVFTFYGQYNPAFQSFNDGEEATNNFVDNGNWNSRVGFTILQPADDLTLRLRFETGLGLRSSALVSQDYTPDYVDWQKTALRWFEVAGEGSLGTVSLGQGSTASDGTAGLDDSATFVAGSTDSTDGFGSFRFRDSDGDLTNVTVGAVNSNFNGARRFRARYDTPVVGGVMLSTSIGKNILVDEDRTTYYDAAFRWTGEVGDFAIRAAAGYQWLDNPDGQDTRRVAGSMTVVHSPTGLNLAVSAGEQIDGAGYVWGRLGWRSTITSAATSCRTVQEPRTTAPTRCRPSMRCPSISTAVSASSPTATISAPTTRMPTAC